MPELQESDPLHITAVEESSGWYQITTDGHPKKLKTNREEGGREAGRYRVDGTRIVIQYSERNDKPNPRGGFFHDFYFYSAKEAPSANGSSDDGITRVKSQAPEKTPEEAWRICLSVGSERAVQLAPHLPSGKADFPFIWALAYEFAQRIYLTPPPQPGSLEPLPVGGGPGAYADPTEPPGDDEDIPF